MATSARPSAEGAIAPATRMGTVRLTVSDMGRSRAFYEETLGLPARELEDGELAFGAGRPLVALRADPGAPSLNRRATGLFHLAVLLPTRLDLARALARLVQTQWPLDGASDHLVSEALYLSDPDGNGIEIYRDRPRDEWRRVDGQLQMATLPLDLRNLADELAATSAPPSPAPAETTIGHVHLQVSELEQIEAFYAGILGFDVIVRSYPGALFVAAGGYHHHLGLNTWQSAGSAAPEPGAIGLSSYEVVLPDATELERVTARISDAGLAVETDSELGGSLVRDPSGNAVLLRTC
ncbi:MAG: VOC family protein [Solirubrobacteraceae bacterium]